MSASTTPAPNYDDGVVKKFMLASIIFGVVGMLVGVWIALELAWWPARVALYGKPSGASGL